MGHEAYFWLAEAAVPTHCEAQYSAYIQFLQAAGLRELRKGDPSIQWNFSCNVISVYRLEAGAIELGRVSCWI